MIELYTAPTPNGHKVSCTLEALGMDYEAILVNLSEGEQKKPDFLKISPNGRIPAIIDTSNNLSIFESGAIMIYLADKANNLISKDPQKRAKVLEWLMFQMGGVGPMMGQANVFFRYFPEKIQPAIDRYQNESRRLFEVLNSHLENNEWLAGDYSIADITVYPDIHGHGVNDVGLDEYPNIKRWHDAIETRPAVQRAWTPFA